MKITARNEFQRIRAEKGYSIQELARVSKVSVGTICKMEHGSAIHPKSAKRLCDALNKEFNELFVIEQGNSRIVRDNNSERI